jgi:glycosyltransferase involved in cell wall biosynthesis
MFCQYERVFVQYVLTFETCCRYSRQKNTMNQFLHLSTTATHATSLTDSPELSVVMPCLNEAETLETCIRKVLETIGRYDIDAEIIIADNGSTDGSQQIAERLGATVVPVPTKGYGAALQAGILAASGQYIIMGDSDDSYDFREIPTLLDKLREGYELVMGNRFKGGIAKGAMPFLHRYLGNPVLSLIGKVFFQIPVNDFHCGLRGFSKAAYLGWNPVSPGMEFASELVVKAALRKASMTEVGVTLSPDGRSRPPHLRTWRDGWRHLHFLLTHSPQWLFSIPGTLLTVVGLLLVVWLLPAARTVGSVRLDVHTLLLAALMLYIGLQALALGWVGRIHAATTGYLPTTNAIRKSTDFQNLTTGIFVSIGLMLLGVGGIGWAFTRWQANAYGDLDPSVMLRYLIPPILLVLIGSLGAMTSFFIGLIVRKR